MHFTDRRQAGGLLSKALEKYKDKDVVVFALPRGGVVTAVEIARHLNAPLELIIARKIGHPLQQEYAIAAITEDGTLIGNDEELKIIDKKWLEKEKAFQEQEAKRRRKIYCKDRKMVSVKGKIALLIDDGIATGLTMQAAILQLRQYNPKKIVIAVPVVSKSTAQLLEKKVDELVSLFIPEDFDFLGAVGAYYEDFSQVEDSEVIDILDNYFHEGRKND